MKVLIFEDEQAAATRLLELLVKVAPQASVVAVIESVKDGVSWLKSNPSPDIILSDIQLADGLSFQIFQQEPVSSPVIFTTAYNEYALKAFKLNSIDYLLKPVDATELGAAFTKFQSSQKITPTNDQFADLFRQLTEKQNQFKSRFLVRVGERFITIPVPEVAFVEADDKVVWLHTAAGQKYIIDDPLDELTRSLDPVNFFRLNRTYITHLNSIEKIHNHFNGRLKIILKDCKDDDIFVSRARVAEFKQWLNR